MNFAAALGDNNPRYFDDTRPGGIVAHPMLAVALTWPLSAGSEDTWGNGGIPPEAQSRQVHYNESILWRRVMRPDEHLEITGEISALLPHPAGSRVVIRYEARDVAGDVVFTEYITGLLRGVALSGEGRGGDGVPDLARAPGELQGAWEQAIALDPLAAHVYDGCTGISFPIHTSACFAREVGLPGPIYQGTATLGLAVREVLNREGAGAPELLAEVHGGFRGMVMPGSAIIVRVLGAQLDNLWKTVYFEVVTAAGETAIRDGRIVLRTAH